MYIINAATHTVHSPDCRFVPSIKRPLKSDGRLTVRGVFADWVTLEDAELTAKVGRFLNPCEDCRPQEAE